MSAAPRRRARGLPDLLLEHAAATPNAVAVIDHSQTRTARVTWRELADRTARIAASLRALSVQAGDRVAIVAGNRTEWLCADLAAQSLGAVSVAIDPAEPPDEVVNTIEHAEAVVAVAEPGAAYDAILATRSRLRFLRRIVLLGTPVSADDPALTAYADLERRGGDHALDMLEDEAVNMETDRVAAIVYTLEHRRGVMLSNHNLLTAGEQLATAVGLTRKQTTGPVRSLALAHQRAVVAAALQTGSTIVLDNVDDNLEGGRQLPEVVVDVAAGWVARWAGEQLRAERRRVSRWSLRVLVDAANRSRAQAPGMFDATRTSIARRLYLKRAQTRLRVRAVRSAVSIAGSLPVEALEMLSALSVPVREAYGLAETSGLATITPAGELHPGSAGRPITRTDLRLGLDNEVLVRGPQVFVGYFKNETASRHTVDPDGWLRTGDVGHIQRDGSLIVTGRTSTALTLPDGKELVPEAIEGRLQSSPHVRRAIVVLSTRDRLVAVIEPHPSTTDAESVVKGEVARLYPDASRLAMRVVVLARPLGRSTGEVFADLRPNRAEIRRRYSSLIDPAS